MSDVPAVPIEDRRRDRRLRRANRLIDEAVECGAMSPEEAEVWRQRALGMDFVALFMLIMEIIQMILDWYQNR